MKRAVAAAMLCLLLSGCGRGGDSAASGGLLGRAAGLDESETLLVIDGREIPALPPLSERMDTAMRQFELAREDKGEHIACLEARKHLAWYLRGVPYSGYYKDKISSISTVEDVQRLAAGIRRDLS